MILWAAGVLVIWSSDRREQRRLENHFVQRGRDIGATLQGWFENMEKRHGPRGKVLRRTLKGLVELGRVEGLALVGGERWIGPKEGQWPALSPPLQAGRLHRMAGHRVMIRIDLQAPDLSNLPPLPPRAKHFEKKRRKTEDWEIPEDLDGVVVAFDTREMDRALFQSRILKVLLGLFSLGGCIAVIWSQRQQHRMHAADLARQEQEQLNGELEEKNLAAAGLAHETRTPLGVLRGRAQMLGERDELPSELRDEAGIIVEEVDRITSRLNDFIAYSRQKEPQLEEVEMSTLLGEVVRLLQFDAEDLSIRLQSSGGGRALVDDGMMRQVCFNLGHNAIQAMASTGGEVKLHYDAGKLRVDDNGPGMSKDVAERCFQPYVSGRSNGTGLGLAVVKQLVRAHGAEIRVESTERGTSFIVEGLKGL